eukprot:15426501-Alexandrium_andersonii.AAC.1
MPWCACCPDVLPAPVMPSEAEVARRNVARCPPADRCSDCIIGTTRGRPHRRVGPDQSNMVQVEYTFWSYGGRGGAHRQYARE